MPKTVPPSNLVVERTPPGTLLVRLSGTWRGGGELPGIGPVREALQEGSPVRALTFDTTSLEGWGSRLLVFVGECAELARGHNIAVRNEGLPLGVRRLQQLAEATPENKEASRSLAHPAFLQNLGEHALRGWDGFTELFRFLGENVLALNKLVRGRAQFRWGDAFLVMQQSGPQALGIVAMINFLVGLILAFVGAIELSRFGASVYVADLVGIATVREMGAIMTGIILSGRTGAAFAAQLGTMKVNQEISALVTFGISPMEFLVLPRMVALVLMMPFLCVFADLISIAGGFFVSISMLDVTPSAYLHRTVGAIKLASFLLGIIKGGFFGFLVAFTGCLRGMQSGNTAAGVGEATTRAVVAGISSIIAADGIFAVISNALHI